MLVECGAERPCMTTDDTLGAAGPAGARSENQCLEWVNRVTLTVGRLLPVYPDKQTISQPVGTSHLCQERKSCLLANRLFSLMQK
jgi:hypothetical protein